MRAHEALKRRAPRPVPTLRSTLKRVRAAEEKEADGEQCQEQDQELINNISARPVLSTFRHGAPPPRRPLETTLHPSSRAMTIRRAWRECTYNKRGRIGEVPPDPTPPRRCRRPCRRRSAGRAGAAHVTTDGDRAVTPPSVTDRGPPQAVAATVVSPPRSHPPPPRLPKTPPSQAGGGADTRP